MAIDAISLFYWVITFPVPRRVKSCLKKSSTPTKTWGECTDISWKKLRIIRRMVDEIIRFAEQSGSLFPPEIQAL